MSWYRRIIVGMVCAMLLAMAAFVAYQVRWYVGFSERLRLAEQHAPMVRRALEADNRFSELEVESFTGQNGCLSVFAVVEPGSVQALKELVESTSPPVPVKYDLHERKAAATGPAR